MGQIFCHLETDVFWNVCFCRPLGSQWKYLIICTKKVKTPCGPLLFFSLFFLCSIIREKRDHKRFFLGRWAFCLKNLCFHQPLRSQRIDLITFTVFVGIPVGPLQFVPWGLSHSIIREERDAEFFLFTGKTAFSFSKICDFNNFLGLEKLLWQAIQWW